MIKNLISICALVGCASTAQVAPAMAAAHGCTVASHYGVGDGYHGLTTANGERYDAYGLTAAHKTLPFGTRLLVTNQSNGKSVVIRINDRGPFIHGRGLDLSYGAFSKIAPPSQGVADICFAKI